MDHVNVSHALQRLCKLHKSHEQSLKRSLAQSSEDAEASSTVVYAQYVEPALAIIDQLVGQTISSFEPWDIALCIWGYGNLRHNPPQLLPQLCTLARQFATRFKAIDCVQVSVRLVIQGLRPVQLP